MKIPQGFRFSGVSVGIKKRANSRDVAMVVSDDPCTIAGVFTTNQVVAAPVVISRSRCPSSNMRGVVINSGNANACTGELGHSNALKMSDLASEQVAKQLKQDITPDSFVVMSTGIIGHQLPMDKVARGIELAAESLASTEDGFMATSDGIMTTDATRKIADTVISLSGKTYSIVAMAKGAGMIGPAMATMLGIVVTDVPLHANQAQRILQYAADRSFNCVSVEGHTSTNDTLLLMATKPDKIELSSEDESTFRNAMTSLCIKLAKMIPDDGEGATHTIEICVRGAKSDKDADTIARSVAMSNLVKTAIYGGDPNWGRIVSAVGYAGVPIRVDALALTLNGFCIFNCGQPVDFNAKDVSTAIREQRLTKIELEVGFGSGTSTHWTSDLGCAYVEFNSEYST
jgi:glutamate N-acetyltransferase / amino-acid N-acetyltransferase